MKTLLIIAILFISIQAQALELNLTAATGLVDTKSDLFQVGVSHDVADWLEVNANAGSFDNHQFIDAGFALKWWRLSIGIGGAYLYSTPDELTGHAQFKPVFGIDVTDNIRLQYIHFSNGQQLFNHSKTPNYGRDFAGVTWRY